MADNVAITAGSGTTVAADDIGGVMHQRVKLSLGADGAAVDAVAGAGAVSTGVQRVTLASDDPVTTSVQIMDDWDESDRAKVNIIVGQAGVAAGSGTNGATVPRVTVATDDSLHTKIGEVQASPTANTLLARLKSIEDKLDTLHTDLGNYEFEYVAASQTAQVIGATGAAGDYLSHLLVMPATTSPGSVTLLDNATSYPVFTTGTLPSTIPFSIPVGARSVSGAWKVTTGANVTVLAVGDFT